MPAKNRRRLDEYGCLTPGRRDTSGESHRNALPRSPSDATCDLPVRYDELLSKKRVLRDEFGATANEIRGESRKEPKKVDHAWRLTPSARGWHL
ncbi:MAG TPA: hypothetical protein VK256_08110 [Candidatus Eisenbacteria bacterium]|nr:hypothetical protein [Candidatus Eisenbacteria bacterium]